VLGSIKEAPCGRSWGMRQPRQLKEGARYHVTARANRKEMILDKSLMKELFHSVVKRAKAKYDFRLENFCIMGNHFHFVIQPGRGESLSAIMRWILSVFAMAYNRIRGFTVHVWGCRFFSRIIASLQELLQVFEYVDDNPVKASQSDDRREWRWGGIWHNRTGCRDLVEAIAAWLRPLLPDHEQLLLTCGA
jgi:putative transposase